MDLFAAILERRSIRKFQARSVSRGDLETIVVAGVEAPSGCNMQLRQFVIVDEPAVLAKLAPFSRALVGAPACIAILAEPKATPYGEYWRQDASASMQNMLLAATGLGLGGCWIEGGFDKNEDAIREILGVPSTFRVCSLMSIGYASEPGQRPEKSLPRDVTHYNRFGEKADSSH
ncbi:MAG: nitroreductase family protein [Phycisphaerae bacterium]|nr:nitroreductase family protein [Phycisphaerae bacterium]